MRVSWYVIRMHETLRRESWRKDNYAVVWYSDLVVQYQIIEWWLAKLVYGTDPVQNMIIRAFMVCTVCTVGRDVCTMMYMLLSHICNACPMRFWCGGSCYVLILIAGANTSCRRWNDAIDFFCSSRLLVLHQEGWCWQFQSCRTWLDTVIVCCQQ